MQPYNFTIASSTFDKDNEPMQAELNGQHPTTTHLHRSFS